MRGPGIALCLLATACGGGGRSRSHAAVDAGGGDLPPAVITPAPDVAFAPDTAPAPDAEPVADLPDDLPSPQEVADEPDLPVPAPDVPPPPPLVTGVAPSNGSGGPLGPGESGLTPLGATIRLPPGYTATAASPVVWLFNEALAGWTAIADADDAVLVDLAEYNDVDAIVAKLEETQTLVQAGYQVDMARYYWAGWSAGGNLAIIIAAQNQGLVAGTLVFPGTGGQPALPFMKGNTGHRIRLFYACGDADPNFQWDVVQNEAAVWAGMGYQTMFVKVPGAAHFIDETLYGIRAQGWAWMRDFNLSN